MLNGQNRHLNNEDRSKVRTSKAKSPKEQHIKKLKTRIAVITLAIAGSSLLARSDRPANQTPTIEGVWQVTRGGVNCNDPTQDLGLRFPAIMTFHRDGTVSGAAKSPLTGPFDTPEHGLWQRESGSQNYSFRALQYRYDGSGTFVGSLVLTANVELSGANSFVYSATIEIADANGVPIPHPLRQGDRNAVSIDICNAPPEKSRRHGRPDLRWGVKGFRVAGRKLRDSQKHFRPHET